MRRIPVLAVTAAAAAAALLATIGPADARDRTVDVQILALNDFHGNLEPPGGSSGRVGDVEAGGAEYLASHIERMRGANPNRTFVVSAGDLIGASPLLSGLFHDEPTIEAMNEIGLDFNAVGNHEFDEGVAELKRMQRGGCHPDDGCLDDTGFDGADFGFLAANVIREKTGKPLFPPYKIVERDGASIAFIGMTLEGTPTIVSAAGIEGYQFRDEAETVNALIPELRERGADAVVVLLHEGGLPATFDPNACNGISGPIVDIVERFDPGVDLVVSGHTHQPYKCVIDGIPTTSAYSFGRLVTDIDMTIDRKAGKVTEVRIDNTMVSRDVAKDEGVTALIERYRKAAAPIANRPVGRITADLLRTADDSREQPLGNAIADAQHFASAPAGAQLALMNPGGVRADMTFAGSPAGEGDGVVTYGELFSVQPFGNGLLTMTLTGTQLEQVLEQQFCGTNAAAGGGFPRVLSPSAGFHYGYRESAIGALDCASADAVDAATMTLDGNPVTPHGSYRVTVNTFLADGGDGFTVLREGTDRAGGVVDTDAFEAYLAEAGDGGLAPPATDRIDIEG